MLKIFKILCEIQDNKIQDMFKIFKFKSKRYLKNENILIHCFFNSNIKRLSAYIVAIKNLKI